MKQLRHKLDMVCKVLDSILLQYLNEKEQRNISLTEEEEIGPGIFFIDTFF